MISYFYRYNGCRCLVTADAMGMAKEGDIPRLVSMVLEARVGTNTVKHHNVPRFGALRRDNTPSPAEPAISSNSSHNECSVSCMRGRGRGPLVTTLSLLYLGGWKCNNYGAVVPRIGGVPGALIGRARDTKVNTHWGGPSSQSPIFWGPQDVSSPSDPERLCGSPCR